jgi:6-pyruvoyltetrahydropterin/6-carboxytetrahydropterin synthase
MDSHMLKTSPLRAAGELVAPPAAILITRRATFAAAHVLRREDWSEDRNREVFGACAGDHGHNYVVEVSVSGAVDPQTGMVVNLKVLDRVIREAVVQHVDHRHLNRDVPFLAGVIPTAENLALAFWEQLSTRLSELSNGGSAQLERVRLVESENNSVEVSR